MNEKEHYVAPEVEVLVIHNEGVICSSGGYGDPGYPGGGGGHNNQGGY